MDLWDSYLLLWKFYFGYKLVLLIYMVIETRRDSSIDAEKSASRWWVIVDLPAHFPYFYSRSFQLRHPLVRLIVVVVNAALTAALVGPFAFAVAKEIGG